MLARGVGRSLRAGTAAIFGRSRDDPAAAKTATPLLTLRWTLSAKRACLVVTDSKPDGFAPLPRQRLWASAGFRWWRRDVAPTPARCCAETVERSFACPSANLRTPGRCGLHPRSVRRQSAAVGTRGEQIRNRRAC